MDLGSIGRMPSSGLVGLALGVLEVDVDVDVTFLGEIRRGSDTSANGGGTRRGRAARHSTR
jgi:hypothetical protein